MAAIGRVLLMDKGAYSGSTIYNQLDWVRDNGAAWVCKVDGTVGIAPPTLPTTSNANWTLMAADGSVSGAVDWGNINNKPFDDVLANGGLDVDANNKLKLDTTFLTGSNIGYDNTASGLSASDVQDAIDELAGMTVDLTTDLLAGSNITLTPKPNGKVEIASTGGGGGGSSTFAGLSDTDVNNPQADQIVQYKSVGGQLKLQNVNMPQGGHTMTPTPNASVDEDDIVTAVNAALLEGGVNDDVVSAYGVGKWTNTDSINLLTAPSADFDTVGAWNDAWETDGIRTGWIWHECLYNVLSDDDVEIRIVNGIGGSEVGCLYAYRVDDNYPVNGVNGGCVAIKLNNTLSSGTKVGVKLIRQRSKTITVTPLS